MSSLFVFKSIILALILFAFAQPALAQPPTPTPDYLPTVIFLLEDLVKSQITATVIAQRQQYTITTTSGEVVVKRELSEDNIVLASVVLILTNLLGLVFLVRYMPRL